MSLDGFQKPAYINKCMTKGKKTEKEEEKKGDDSVVTKEKSRISGA